MEREAAISHCRVSSETEGSWWAATVEARRTWQASCCREQGQELDWRAGSLKPVCLLCAYFSQFRLCHLPTV